ncbi:unnamed protein product [Ilex paraguariensis]|uniref:FAR1 domain-containing protein n=1 Tax=Ilex paraguariensis TaxID=185542 RepID=A0ABC8R6Z6_9AQUA
MRDRFGPARKPHLTTREGCKAMMLVKVDKSSSWVLTRFIKEHTHPLVVYGCPSRNTMDPKDRRIQVLTMELERQDKICDLYQEQLITFLRNVVEQTELLSTKIQDVVNNVRDFETGVQKSSNHQ